MTFSMICLVRQIDGATCSASRPACSHTVCSPHVVTSLPVHTDTAPFGICSNCSRYVVCYSSRFDVGERKANLLKLP
jgi:hypothetical protein